MFLYQITFDDMLTVANNVINSGPVMLVICIIAFIISRRLNRLNEQAIYDRIVKQGNDKIKANYNLARADIKRRVNEANDYIKAHQPSALEQAAEVVQRVDSNLSNVSVEGWSNYSDSDKAQIVAAMKEQCRFGKHNLGPIAVNISTGHVIKSNK